MSTVCKSIKAQKIEIPAHDMCAKFSPLKRITWHKSRYEERGLELWFENQKVGTVDHITKTIRLSDMSHRSNLGQGYPEYEVEGAE